MYWIGAAAAVVVIGLIAVVAIFKRKKLLR
jgi:uncharacterized membrane protein